MRKTAKYLLACIAISALSGLNLGCSSLKFPGVYRLKVQQGNYIKQEDVDKLKIGMTKRQVRYVMGTPLVEDTFNTNRWDYYFSTRKGDETLREKRFSVFFENDKLQRWRGDITPNESGDTVSKEKVGSAPSQNNNSDAGKIAERTPAENKVEINNGLQQQNTQTSKAQVKPRS